MELEGHSYTGGSAKVALLNSEVTDNVVIMFDNAPKQMTSYC